MNSGSVLVTLTPLLREVFNEPTLVVTPDLTASEVRGWDSLGHVRLFFEIEQTFSIRFEPGEISSLERVGEIADLIATKIESSK